MTYRVNRHDNTRISIERDGKLAFEIERGNGGRGIWELYPVHAGVRGAKIMADQYSNDLIEVVTCEHILAGHLAEVSGGYVVPVPAHTRDFFISGTGYLCCRSPVRMVLTERPVTAQGVHEAGQIRVATAAERVEAGLPEDASLSAVFMRRS